MVQHDSAPVRHARRHGGGLLRGARSAGHANSRDSGSSDVSDGMCLLLLLQEPLQEPEEQEAGMCASPGRRVRGYTSTCGLRAASQSGLSSTARGICTAGPIPRGRVCSTSASRVCARRGICSEWLPTHRPTCSELPRTISQYWVSRGKPTRLSSA